MNPQRLYMAKLTALIRKSPPAPLEAVLRARLTGDLSEVCGIVSPPLTRDEPDACLLLYYVYDALEDEPTAREYLRHAIARLTVAALAEPVPDLDYIEALGRLVGYTRIRDAGPLAEQLRFQFLGLLGFGLPEPLERIMDLHGVGSARARHILDLFLAVTPPLWTGIGASQRARFIEAFRQAGPGFAQPPRDFDLERFQLLLLLFRAVLKLEPEFAGGVALAEVCETVAAVGRRHTGGPGTDIRRDWLGTCWELGLLLNDEAHADWKGRFLAGLHRQSTPEGLTRPAFRAIFQDALTELGFEAEAEAMLAPNAGDREWKQLIRQLSIKILIPGHEPRPRLRKALAPGEGYIRGGVYPEAQPSIFMDIREPEAVYDAAGSGIRDLIRTIPIPPPTTHGNRQPSPTGIH